VSSLRKVDARADGVGDKGFVEAAVLRDAFRGRGAARNRDLRRFFEVLDLEAEVEDAFRPAARRDQRKIDVTVGNEDRGAVSLTAYLAHPEGLEIELCECGRIVCEEGNVPDT
jgi:hypothetical protein